MGLGIWVWRNKLTVNLYSFVVMYRRALDTASHLLAKGVAHAKDQGIAEQDILEWRLVDDMNPLAFQLAVVTNYAQGWPARAAGVTVPEAVTGSELDIAGFEAALANAKAFLDTLTPEQFAGRDDTPLTFKITDGMEPTLLVGQWITGFATVNITFHLSMAYAILRAKGVPLGKVDLFPAGL